MRQAWAIVVVGLVCGWGVLLGLQIALEPPSPPAWTRELAMSWLPEPRSVSWEGLQKVTGSGRDEALGEALYTLVVFGYASCPDVCPTTLAQLRDELARLPKAVRQDLEVVFVTVDPARDTPERLVEYLRYFSTDFAAATAPVDVLKDFGAQFGAWFRDEGGGLFAHPSRVYVIAGGDQWVGSWRVPQAAGVLAKDLGVVARRMGLRR